MRNRVDSRFSAPASANYVCRPCRCELVEHCRPWELAALGRRLWRPAAHAPPVVPTGSDGMIEPAGILGPAHGSRGRLGGRPAAAVAPGLASAPVLGCGSAERACGRPAAAVVRRAVFASEPSGGMHGRAAVPGVAGETPAAPVLAPGQARGSLGRACGGSAAAAMLGEARATLWPGSGMVGRADGLPPFASAPGGEPKRGSAGPAFLSQAGRAGFAPPPV